MGGGDGGAERIDGGLADIRYGVARVEQPALGLHRVGLLAEFVGSGHGVGVLEQRAEPFPGRLAFAGEFGQLAPVLGLLGERVVLFEDFGQLLGLAEAAERVEVSRGARRQRHGGRQRSVGC